MCGSSPVIIEDLSSPCRPSSLCLGKEEVQNSSGRTDASHVLYLFVKLFISDEGGGRILEEKELNELVILAS